jgi:hypothetical protein
MTFCTDIDLLHWEPAICRDAAFASQTLIGGTGNLTGTTFAIASGSFTGAHVAADQVLVLSGALNGSFPIFSVDGATQLTVSALYDGLFPAEGSPTPTPPGTATGLAYTIRTFWPQRRIISEMILTAAGLDPADAAAGDKILNPAVLVRPCALGTLHLIYSALAAVAEDPKNLLERVTLYERLYRGALRGARVELDLDGDGRADAIRTLGVLELVRI